MTESKTSICLERLKSIQIDMSWKVQYDSYLQRFCRGNRGGQPLDLCATPDTQISLLHTTEFNNLFNVAKAKRPIQNIYKRPI